MKNYKNIIRFIALLICGARLMLRAQQDPMVSQYMFSGHFINPAYAGSHPYANITLLGRNIPVNQAGIVYPPLITVFGWSNNVVQFGFTNGTPGAVYSVLFTTNLTVPLPDCAEARLSAWAVLSGANLPGRRVLVVDEEYGFQALSAADYLLDRGKEISLAKKIEVTRKRFRRSVLGCNYTLQATIDTLEKAEKILGAAAAHAHRQRADEPERAVGSERVGIPSEAWPRNGGRDRRESALVTVRAK